MLILEPRAYKHTQLASDAVAEALPGVASGDGGKRSSVTPDVTGGIEVSI